MRAGPLLLAPLYDEQAASVHSGAMTLPRPGGWGIHQLVSRFVHAGQPDIPDGAGLAQST